MARAPLPPNSTHLRDDIDQGRTGDKTPGFDPAAAPLGVDEEAGGAGPTAAEISQAREQERRLDRPERHPNAAEPALAPNGAARPAAGLGHWVVVGVIGLTLAATVVFALNIFAYMAFGMGGGPAA